MDSQRISVISSEFCSPDEVKLRLPKHLMKVTDGNFSVCDSVGDLIFDVKGVLMSFHECQSLLDSAGNTLLTMRKKIWSVHRKWQAYRGNSKKDQDLLFSVRNSKIPKSRVRLNVFIAGNTTEDECDFRMECVSDYHDSWLVFLGNSSTTIAQFYRSSKLIGKDTFIVTVNPHVDQAFIVALVMILNEIISGKRKKASAGNAAGPVAVCLTKGVLGGVIVAAIS